MDDVLFGSYGSDSSSNLGSEPVAVVRMADIAQIVKQARDEQKTLLQEARDEQKIHTANVIRVISDMMVLGVATLIVVIVLCTFVLYTKPSVNTMCDPVVNHKWEPCAQPVNHTTCEPVNNTTVNIVVHVHVHVNATSFVDTPDDECSINDKKMYDLALHDATLAYKHEIKEKTFTLLAGIGLGFAALGI